MKREDYLMRLLEEFGRRMGQLLANVADMARGGHSLEAHASLEDGVAQLVGLSTTGVLQLPDDVLLQVLRADATAFWPERGAYLAVLLRADGQLYDAEGHEEQAVARYLKALMVMLMVVDQEQSAISEDDVEQMLNWLYEYQLPGPISAALMAYHERHGRFAAAEDVLFDWLESETAVTDLNAVNPVEVGVAFYNRLLQKEDAELAAGNLPREEVEAGLAELTE